MQFLPDEFETPSDMFEAVYPDVAAAPECLLVLGVGELDAEESVEFGPSKDYSLTASVSSSADSETAAAYLESIKEAGTCADDPKITFQGDELPVEINTDSATLDGADENFTIELAGDVSGDPISIIGTVALAGNEVLLLAGWDPASNEANVPLAAGMFLTKLDAARN